MNSERLHLGGVERARYYLPTAICFYLATLCLVLTFTSTFLRTLQNAVAVTAAGLFGLLLSAGLGFVFWQAQRRDLSFTLLRTTADAPSNFAAVRAAALRAGWRILREDAPRRLDAQTPSAILDVGERVTVQFRDSDVLVASICDPSIGFSLVGRRKCAEHRELVRRTVDA
jgi:hypothetical protein